jgi:ABC-type multidrug transport system permease subunit
LPAAIFIVVYFTKYSSGVYAYLGIKNILGSVAPKTMSLCAIANLIPFYYFLQTNRMSAVKGVLIGTVVVAVLVFLVFLLF